MMDAHLLKVMRDHADRLLLGKKAVISFQDWLDMRNSLRASGEHSLVMAMESLIDEQEFSDLLTDVIYK